MFGAFPARMVQVADEGLKVPVEFEVKVTVPVGTVGLVELSITLAAQVVDVLTKTDPGEQVTTVIVECTGGGAADETESLTLPVLAECADSPL
jgi:hypothetical protein